MWTRELPHNFGTVYIRIASCFMAKSGQMAEGNFYASPIYCVQFFLLYQSFEFGVRFRSDPLGCTCPRSLVHFPIAIRFIRQDVLDILGQTVHKTATKDKEKRGNHESRHNRQREEKKTKRHKIEETNMLEKRGRTRVIKKFIQEDYNIQKKVSRNGINIGCAKKKMFR